MAPPRQRRSDKTPGNTPPTRPSFSFGLWLRLHGPDLVTMALMGALGLGIYEARE